MKKTILMIFIALSLGAFSVGAQTPTTTPAPPTDQDMSNPDAEDKVFPPDVVDTTINDTTYIDDIKVDSTMRMEDKKQFERREKQEDRIDNNSDGSKTKRNKKRQ